MDMEDVVMEREKAFEELKARLVNEDLIKHSLAVEAIMRALAIYSREDAELWGLTGLLHDIDCERTAGSPSLHGIVGAEILRDLGMDEELVYAVRVHNEMHNLVRKRKIDKALYCADPVSGLITAGALVLPSKMLSDVSADFILKQMNEKSFARGANREQIGKCDELGLSLEQFIEIALNAMKGISNDLGL